MAAPAQPRPMSGHGERPTDDSEEVDDEHGALAFGETLYTEDGTPVGEVRGIDESGVFVTFREGTKRFAVERGRSGHEFGETELVWRCTECGEMGTISAGLPDTCPSCGANREALMYWTED